MKRTCGAAHVRDNPYVNPTLYRDKVFLLIEKRFPYKLYLNIRYFITLLSNYI